MEDKTEQLRDIFLSVSEEGTVTESQTEDRGSLLRQSEGDLPAVVEQLREKFGFELSIAEEQRCRLIEEFYNGTDDEQLAEELDLDTETVFEARMELHLLREGEPELREETVEVIHESERPAAELAEQVDAAPDEIRRCRAVLDTRERSRRVSQRFRTAYEERLTDIELSEHLATDTHEDGLDDATEGAEVDVDF